MKKLAEIKEMVYQDIGWARKENIQFLIEQLDKAIEILAFWSKLVEQDRVFDPEQLSEDEIMVWGESKKFINAHTLPATKNEKL